MMEFVDLYDEVCMYSESDMDTMTIIGSEYLL